MGELYAVLGAASHRQPALGALFGGLLVDFLRNWCDSAHACHRGESTGSCAGGWPLSAAPGGATLVDPWGKRMSPSLLRAAELMQVQTPSARVWELFHS